MHKPNEVKGRKLWVFLISSILASTISTFFFALLLYEAKIPITVILPTSAPVWIGISTLVFMVLKET